MRKIPERWWESRDYFINQPFNEDYGTQNVYARQTDDGWEYAIVSWRYGTPFVQAILKHGKAYDEHGRLLED